ncbi:hypothetical protein BJP34_22425 [Moorena producens PAL-8-15-08-1]|uniref:EF-hand domain-containing protein n=1 Tax=Moorena producens PAL-8-15-08-1 TaxID=1458985 RepID=A0A1D8TVY8_9CYAN|nr:EF-hand domain-containing protein [Moorena producens]AOX01822.1 hypothetical protein BJP34_22425 [Moorena producens PAL-8-15-08-1]
MLSELQQRKLTRLFNLYDQQTNGVLTQADFERITDNLAAIRGWTPGSPYYDNLLAIYMRIWNGVQKFTDQNQDQQVTLDEWLTYHENVLSDTEGNEAVVNAKAAGIIFLLDSDKDDKVTLEEYRQFFQAYGIDDSQIEEIFGRFDQNNDGYIDKQEILDLVTEFYYSQDPEAPGNWIFGSY